jgi:hypothetical protein
MSVVGVKSESAATPSLVTVTVHLISILEMVRARGVVALGDAVRLVRDDDSGRGGMSIMQVMVIRHQLSALAP